MFLKNRNKILLTVCLKFIGFINIVELTGDKFQEQKVPEMKRAPVIIIPGLAGSQLEVKLDFPSSYHLPWYCFKRTTFGGYERLWVNLYQFLQLACGVRKLALLHDSQTNFSKSAPGIDVRVTGLLTHDVDSISYIDSATRCFSHFSNMIQNLTQIGYDRNVDLFAAPYDFRRAPHEDAMKLYYEELRTLIENVTDRFKRDRGVVLLGHSYGAIVAQYFLSMQNPEWKEKHVHMLITLGSPFGGTVNSLQSLISGAGPMRFAAAMSEALRTYPSVAYLMPQHRHISKDHILVTLNNTKFSLANVTKLFRMAGFSAILSYYESLGSQLQDLPPPNVTTHILYGSNISTVSAIHYYHDKELEVKEVEEGSSIINASGMFSEFSMCKIMQGTSSEQKIQFQGKSTENNKHSHLYNLEKDLREKDEYEDGDGTVLLSSLTAFRKWVQTKAVQKKEFSGVEHYRMIKHPHVLNYIKQQLLS